MLKWARHYDGKGNELRLDETRNGDVRITIGSYKEFANGKPSAISIVMSEDELRKLIDLYDEEGKHANHA